MLELDWQERQQAQSAKQSRLRFDQNFCICKAVRLALEGGGTVTLELAALAQQLHSLHVSLLVYLQHAFDAACVRRFEMLRHRMH